MPTISNYGNKPYIELSLEPNFIRKHKLELVLNNSSIYDNFILSSESTVSFKYPYLFPPQKKNLPENYLTGFLHIYSSIINEFDLIEHADRLLFLSNIYTQINAAKEKDLFKSKVLMQNGKLLVEFIKAPITLYTMDNISDAFDGDQLDKEEIDDLLELYLITVSKDKKSDFETNEGIDYSAISTDLQSQIINRILIDQNISIEMDNGNYLVVSKNIKAKFGYVNKNKTAKFEAKGDWQNQELTKLIIESLFKEQKEAKTDLYYSLLNFDYFSPRDIKSLSYKVNNYDKSGHHTHNIKAFHSVLNEYFKSEKILTGITPTYQNRKRNDFIYKYLILFNFFKEHLPINEIEKQFVAFNIKNRLSKNYAAKTFADSFKNLDRKDNLYYNYLRSNS